MNQVFKIALPGYNAETDTDPDHFALYVDGQVDYILIKEKTKDTIEVNVSETIAHNLGYTPFCLVFAETASGVWRKLFSRAIAGPDCYFEVNNTNLLLYNSSGSPVNFSYHIFYDNIT